jgi:5'-phosphate synthase pdxT subunit
MPQLVGVLAVQGDYSKHLAMLRSIEATLLLREVRTVEDLGQVDRLIIPGGESTTVGLLLQRYGLGAALQAEAKKGMPMWGTCMGMILMAKEVEGREQYSLGLLDITVERNAFGAQVNSFEDEVPIKGLKEPVTAVFIRAPVVSRAGPGVEELASYHGRIVAVRQGNLVGTSFHPELTNDTRFHEWFLRL